MSDVLSLFPSNKSPAPTRLRLARVMIDMAIGVDVSDEALCQIDDLDAVECWARTAAAFGRMSDITRLAGILMLRAASAPLERDQLRYSAEAASHLDALADAGCTEADTLLLEVGRAMSPAAMSLAASVNRHLNEGAV